MADYTRKRWQQIKSIPSSLGKLFRIRSRYIHISKPIVEVTDSAGLTRRIVTPEPGVTRRVR